MKTLKGDLNSYEVVSNLGEEVGHFKTAHTDAIVHDTEDYRLSSKQLKEINFYQKDQNRTYGV